MILETVTVAATYELIKYWGPVIGIIAILYKGFDWLKGIRTKDLAELKTAVTELKLSLTEGKESNTKGLVEIKESLQTQTASIVGELREQRSDLRTLFQLLMAPSTPARIRASKAVKKSK